jgi:hypothetical protein
MSVRLSEGISAAPIGRISAKFDIEDLYENLSKTVTNQLKWEQGLSAFCRYRRHLNRRKSALFD